MSQRQLQIMSHLTLAKKIRWKHGILQDQQMQVHDYDYNNTDICNAPLPADSKFR